MISRVARREKARRTTVRVRDRSERKEKMGGTFHSGTLQVLSRPRKLFAFAYDSTLKTATRDDVVVQTLFRVVPQRQPTSHMPLTRLGQVLPRG